MRKRLLTLAVAVLAMLQTAWAYDFSATSPSGQVECILDDETKEWLTMIGQPVLIRLDDRGNMTDIRCRVSSIGQEGE